MGDEIRATIVEKPSYRMAERTMHLQTYELDHKGDILLIVDCSLSRSKKVNCTHHRETDDLVPPTTAAQSSSSLSSHVQDAGYHDTPPPLPPLQIPVDRIAEAAGNLPKLERYPCARFKVSSRHLALSSPVFKHMFDECLTNNGQPWSSSLTELPLHEDDPDALLILLHAIHGRFRRVPRKVDLKTLTQIAILVDKYELLEVTDLLLDHWLRDIEDTFPSTFDDDLLSRICVAYIFQRETTLQKLIGIATLESSGILDRGNLPIQSQVSSINSRRQSILSEIFAYLKQIEDRLLCERTCPQNFECDGMLLGCLQKRMRMLHILPTPPPPYENISVRALFKNLKAMQVPRQCERQGKKVVYGECNGVEGPLKTKIHDLKHEYGLLHL